MFPPFGKMPENLPFHLMLAMMQQQAFGANSASWSDAFSPWNLPWMQHLAPKSDLQKWLELLQSLAQNPLQSAPPKSANPLADAGLWAALGDEAVTRSRTFFEGMEAYLSRPTAAPTMDYPVLWQRGSARLLDVAPRAKGSVAVFCVPSLINKSYILDLYKDASLVQHLAARGMRPLVLDWASPGEDEEGFTCEDYITAYALDALQTLRKQHDGPIVVLGYCMGGIMAAALAQLAPFLCDGLVLLATPWDFSAPDAPIVLLNPATQMLLTQWFAQSPQVQPWVIQSIFHLIDPFAVQRKYSRFAEMSEAEKQHFIAVEHWANDGVPLTREVAQECFVNWPQKNMLAKHQWKLGRQWMEPARIACPTLAFVPQNDRIVPSGCARPLTRAIPRCLVKEPECGHVSMVVGPQAKKACWQPICEWITSLF